VVIIPRPVVPTATIPIPTIPRQTVPVVTQTAAPPIPTVRIPINVRPFVPPPAEAPRARSPRRMVAPGTPPSPRTLTPPSPRAITLPQIPAPTIRLPTVVRTPSPPTRVIAYVGERPIFEPHGVPAVPAPTGERTTANALRTRVQNIPQGKVLNVSNIRADGTGARIMNERIPGRTNFRGIQGIPIVSNNSQAFITAMSLLYDNYYEILPFILQLQGQYPGW
jgi:hypothetical protein